MSTPSSFEKPELSKACDSGARNKIQTKRRRSQQQQEKDSNTNQIRKSSMKAQNNVDPSATSLSGIDPVAVKAVTFEKTARVRRVRPRSQISQTEREAMWYNDNDYTDIKRRAVETVKRMMKGEKSEEDFVDDDNYTSRGLECRMKKNAVERKRFKSYARGLVLEEQDYQNETGIMCSGRLRKVYLKSSSIALMKAQDNGQKDAEAIHDVS